MTKAASLAHGRQFLAIPGPTTVPDSVLAAMHRPAVDIYHKDLEAVTADCLDGLRWIMQTEHLVHMYIANGHGAWEAAISNTLSRGDTVLALESGRFARGWGELATQIGVRVQTVPSDDQSSVDLAAFEAALSADTAGEIKAVLVCQVDTASGAVNHIPDVRTVIDKVGHNALFMVDTIASLATMPFYMDEWNVDVTVGAVQKGLMSSPGISFSAASPKAMAAHETAGLRTMYWDWTVKAGPLHYQKYCGTPPEHLLFGMQEGLRLLREQGLEQIYARHEVLSKAVKAAVSVWAEGGAISFNMTKPEDRSNAVTTILCENPEQLRDFCLKKLGVVLGSGIGDWDGKAFRIAHMGHVNAPMILGTLGAVDVALKALNIPHGEGAVAAAIEQIHKGL